MHHDSSIVYKLDILVNEIVDEKYYTFFSIVSTTQLPIVSDKYHKVLYDSLHFELYKPNMVI